MKSRKFISICLIVCMMLSLTTGIFTVFAESTTVGSGNGLTVSRAVSWSNSEEGLVDVKVIISVDPCEEESHIKDLVWEGPVTYYTKEIDEGAWESSTQTVTLTVSLHDDGDTVTGIGYTVDGIVEGEDYQYSLNDENTIVWNYSDWNDSPDAWDFLLSCFDGQDGTGTYLLSDIDEWSNEVSDVVSNLEWTEVVSDDFEVEGSVTVNGIGDSSGSSDNTIKVLSSSFNGSTEVTYTIKLKDEGVPGFDYDTHEEAATLEFVVDVDTEVITLAASSIQFPQKEPLSDIEVKLELAPGQDNPVDVGDTITYQVTVTNIGESTLEDLKVTDLVSGFESSVFTLDPEEEKSDITFEYTTEFSDAGLEIVNQVSVYDGLENLLMTSDVVSCFVNMAEVPGSLTVDFDLDEVEENGVSAIGVVSKINDNDEDLILVVEGDTVEITITLSGTAEKSGIHTVNLESDLVSIVAESIELTCDAVADELCEGSFVFTFEMPNFDVDDLTVSHTFVGDGEEEPSVFNWVDGKDEIFDPVSGITVKGEASYEGGLFKVEVSVSGTVLVGGTFVLGYSSESLGKNSTSMSPFTVVKDQNVSGTKSQFSFTLGSVSEVDDLVLKFEFTPNVVEPEPETYSVSFQENNVEKNGLSAVGVASVTEDVEEGDIVLVTITVAGEAVIAGTHTIGLTSDVLDDISVPASVTIVVEDEEVIDEDFIFGFTMPGSDVDDLIVTHDFVPVSDPIPEDFPISFAVDSVEHNGLFAVGSVSPASEQIEGTPISVTVALSGIAENAGEHTISISSPQAGTITAPPIRVKEVVENESVNESFVFTFIMPGYAVSDLTVIHTFVEDVPDTVLDMVISTTLDDGQNDVVAIGEGIRYSIKVENTGNSTLNNIKVFDSQGKLLHDSFVLNAGLSRILEYVDTVPASAKTGDIISFTPYATAYGILGQKTSNKVDVSVDPKLSMVVTHSLAKDQSDVVKVGDTVKFTVSIRNTGFSPISNIEITNSLNNDKRTFATINKNSVQSFDYSHVVKEADVEGNLISSTVLVKAKDLASITKETSAYVKSIGYSLSVENVLSSSSKSVFAVGERLSYKITVINTGSGDVSGISTRNSLESSWKPSTFSLKSGESKVINYTYTVKDSDIRNGKLSNLVTVTSKEAKEVKEDCIVDIKSLESGISLKASVKSSPDTIKVGSSITYSFIVENTGEVALKDLVISSLLNSTWKNNISSLGVGQSREVTFTYKITEAGDLNNVASVVGYTNDILNDKVTASDTHKLTVKDDKVVSPSPSSVNTNSGSLGDDFDPISPSTGENNWDTGEDSSSYDGLRRTPYASWEIPDGYKQVTKYDSKGEIYYTLEESGTALGRLGGVSLPKTGDFTPKGFPWFLLSGICLGGFVFINMPVIYKKV